LILKIEIIIIYDSVLNDKYWNSEEQHANRNAPQSQPIQTQCHVLGTVAYGHCTRQQRIRRGLRFVGSHPDHTRAQAALALGTKQAAYRHFS